MTKMAATMVASRFVCLSLFLLLIKGCTGENETCEGKDLADKMDNAVLNITSPLEIGHTLDLWMQTEECWKCDLVKKASIKPNSKCFVYMDTRWPMLLEINSTNITVDQSCSIRKSYEEYGRYVLYVYNSGNKSNIIVKCRSIVLNNMPADTYIPIYAAVGFFVGVAAIWIIGLHIYRQNLLQRYLIRSGAERLVTDPKSKTHENPDLLVPGNINKNKTTNVRKRTSAAKSSASRGQNAYMSEDLGSMPAVPTNINPGDNNESNKPKKERLKSLDTFRGLSLTIMCFVNYGGGGYWFFNHSKWNGLTVADLVFPWFVFIMGTAMAYSFNTQIRRCVPKHQMFFKIFKRSCILFLLGLVINTGGGSAVALEKLRIMGVLQRFALTYLIIATMHMFFAKTADVHMHAYWNRFRDILYYWPEWIINFALLAVYLSLTFGLDVPGCGKGYIGPGGLHDHSQHFNCTGGAAGYIDRQIFGDKHVYQSPTSKSIYNSTAPYDPEGLLGTLTSCLICFLGLQAGKILMIFKSRRGRVMRFLVWGFILCLIAGILCKFSQNDGWIPINKNLWSLSFVLCLSGMGFILLAFCYLTIDEWKVWNGAPFYYPGMNAILLYMGHEVFSRHFPVSWRVAESHASILPLSLWGTTFWVLISVVLYYKEIFITV